RTRNYKGAKVGNVFVSSKGYVVCPSYGTGVAYDNEGEIKQVFAGGSEEGHFENFIRAVRARNNKILNADILEGHLSSALCHLGNISYRLGQVSSDGDLTEFFKEGKNPLGLGESARETFGRLKAHLADNKVDPQGGFRTGRKLAIDPKTESFVNDSTANEMLFREYRKGFEVPDKV